MIPGELPSSWRALSLRELHAGGVTSLDPQDSATELFEYYSIPAYQDGARPLTVMGSAIQSQKLVIPARCLLFGKLNPRVEKVWNVKSTQRTRRLASTEWLPIVPTDQLDQDFGYYLLRSQWVMPIAKGLVSGSTPSRERVEPKSFYDIVVPIPPIEEQRAIAAILATVDEAINAQTNLLAALDELKQVAMGEIFSRGLRGDSQKTTELGLVPETWDVVALGTLGRIGNGSTPKKTTAAYWNGGTYPWLTSAKVYDREIVSADQFVTEQALLECHLPRVGPGAVLIAITGEGKTLGHCAVLRTEATISQHVAYVAMDNARVDPSFVRGYLETQYDYLRQVASGGGSTKGALTCAFLRGVLIPFPAIDEQREIAEILDGLDQKIALHQRKRLALEELFKTVLHALITGEVRADKLSLVSAGARTPEVAA